MLPILYLVIPCYNEEKVIEETNKRLNIKLDKMVTNNLISDKSRIMYVNDGSKDSTWEIITKLFSESKYTTGISLSRNKGHQNALLAGLMTAKELCDITISMDADLQDDIEVLDKFVEEYNNGCDIVYGVRSSRKTDTVFKRSTALMFYTLMSKLGVDMVYNHADYRLMSKRALNDLENFKEVNLFLRGIIPMIGYKTSTVEYERGERFAGESKYPLKKMIAFAIEGITSCSVKPLRLITLTGIAISIISVFFLVYTIIGYFYGSTLPGWASTIVILCFLGGFQIFAIGIVGEYIGKIYLEVKQRPRFIVGDKHLK